MLVLVESVSKIQTFSGVKLTEKSCKEYTSPLLSGIYKASKNYGKSTFSLPFMEQIENHEHNR